MMDINFALSLVSLLITIVTLSFLLGVNLTKVRLSKEIEKLTIKVVKLKSKKKKNDNHSRPRN